MNEIIKWALAISDDPRMSEDEMIWLYRRIKELYEGGNTLEIGAYRGMLSYLFARRVHESGRPESKHVIVDAFDIPIDIDEENTHHYGDHTEALMMANMGAYKDRVKTVRSKSLDWLGADTVINGEYDMVFIDGDHRDPIVYLELTLCGNSVKHILGHDYGWPGVTKSVDRFCKEKGYKVYQPLSGRGVFELIKE